MRPSLFATFSILAMASTLLGQDTQTRVDQIFEDLEIARVSEVWELAGELEALGPNAIVHIKRGLHHANPSVRLASGKALFALGEEREMALKALIGLLHPEEDVDKEVRLLASDLIYLHAKKRREVRAISEYMSLTHDPFLKISMAKTLVRRGRNSSAVKTLKNYLESDNLSIRASAALALAEVGNVEAAKPVLVSLQNEPTPRGSLARLYLDQDKILESIDATQSLARDPQIAALREQVADLQKQNKELMAANRMAAGGAGGGGEGGDFPKVAEILKKIRQYYVTDEGGLLDEDRLIDAALKGMVKSLDPFSSYLTKADWDKFIEGMSQEYAGIGAYVNKNPNDGYLTISRPFYSGPAFQAGLRSLDKIIKVDGASTDSLDLSQIIDRLKGTPNTPVKVTVFRNGWDKPRDFDLVRRKIEVKSVHSEMLPGSIGYLSLSQFGREAVAEVGAALNDLEARGMVGLIFDLRNNGGGYLDAARGVADFFLPAGKVVCFSKGRNQVVAKYTEHKTRDEPHPSYPVVILVNGATASAAEIVSGALSDHKRAQLVGTKTFGKGSVQQLFSLDSSEGRLRLTIAKYYLPSGRSIHQKGIEPDIDVPLEVFPRWKQTAFGEIAKAVEDYAFRLHEEDKELCQRLAIFDSYDASQYPGFDEFMAGLGTELPVDDVRRAVRSQVRRLVQDDLGHFMPTDLQADRQLQRSIYELFTNNGMDLSAVPEYARFAGDLVESSGPPNGD